MTERALAVWLTPWQLWTTATAVTVATVMYGPRWWRP